MSFEISRVRTDRRRRQVQQEIAGEAMTLCLRLATTLARLALATENRGCAEVRLPEGSATFHAPQLPQEASEPLARCSPIQRPARVTV